MKRQVHIYKVYTGAYRLIDHETAQPIIGDFPTEDAARAYAEARGWVVVSED